MDDLPVVCLVGSTKPEWRQRYMDVQRELCYRGYVVLSVSVFKNGVNEAEMESHRELLERIHFKKMDMAAVVVLIHADAVGTHTAMEMARCRRQGKPLVVFTNGEEADGRIRHELNELEWARRRRP